MFKKTGILLCLMLATASAQAFELNLNKLVDMVGKTKDLKTVDTAGEIEIGEGVVANLLGAVPLVQDETLQTYVNQLGSWLVQQQSDRTDLTWRFGVLDTDNLNAFAAPGGYVFITKGLLLNMRNEAELAGVLAHEISHVLKRHHLDAIQKSAKTGIVADLASMAVSNSKYGGLGEKAIGAGTELYARGLDKEDEFEADRMGVVIAARAGYDPYGLPAVLQTLDSMNAQDSNLALMFKTHPAPQKRLELLDGVMAEKMDRYEGEEGQERFMKVVRGYAEK